MSFSKENLFMLYEDLGWTFYDKFVFLKGSWLILDSCVEKDFL